MSELHPGDRAFVTQRLRDAGLQGPTIDIDAIVADSIERLAMDRSLDSLIGAGTPGGDGEIR